MQPINKPDKHRASPSAAEADLVGTRWTVIQGTPTGLGSAGRAFTMPTTTSLGTRRPSSMKPLARVPAAVPAATSSRSRSPADTCTSPNCTRRKHLCGHTSKLALQSVLSPNKTQVRRPAALSCGRRNKKLFASHAHISRYCMRLLSDQIYPVSMWYLLHNALALRSLASCWCASNHDVQRRAHCPKRILPLWCQLRRTQVRLSHSSVQDFYNRCRSDLWEHTVEAAARHKRRGARLLHLLLLFCAASPARQNLVSK